MVVGKANMTDHQIQSNVEAAEKSLLAQIPGGKKNIRALYLRATESPSVPLYASLGKIV